MLAILMHYQIILVQVLLTAPGKALASLVRGLYKVLAQPLNGSGAVPEPFLLAACTILAQGVNKSCASPERFLCRSCSLPPDEALARLVKVL